MSCRTEDVESDLLGMIKEYLKFKGYEKTILSLTEDHKGKTSTKMKTRVHDVRTSLLGYFHDGDQDSFFRLWTEHIPADLVERDVNALSLELYLHIHFTVFPLRMPAKRSQAEYEERISKLKEYFKTQGAALSQTAEFLPYYALPYVSDPTVHPLFKALFEESWMPQLKKQLEEFLMLTVKPSYVPRLLALCQKEGGRSSREDIQQLQLKLTEADKRAVCYAGKFRKIQADYYKLIGITAELVKALEATVAGEMISPDYLQSLCVGLRNSQIKQNMEYDSRTPHHDSYRSSILQALMKPQLSVEVPMLPSLNYVKLKADIVDGDQRRASLLLQALCWRLTHSLPGDQREIVLQAYICNDLLEGYSEKQKTVIGLLASPSEVILEYMVRLINAFASFADGRGYLSNIPSLLKLLTDVLKKEKTPSIKEKALMAIQKLSLRRSQQTAMIEDDLISWLVDELQDSDCLSDNTLEYSAALLLNLCLRTKGRRKCADDAKHVLKVLTDLLGHENHQIRSFVNGTLYSIFCVPSVREEAKEMSFEAILQCYTKEGNPNFSSQIGFIIKLLNSAKEEDPESDEEEGDDNNEDLLERDLDNDEILQPQPGELSGESLLTTEYLGIMTNMTQVRRKSPILHQQSLDEPLQRPVTPNCNARPAQKSKERSPSPSQNHSIASPGSRPGTSDSFRPSIDSECGRLSQESELDRSYEDGATKAHSKEASGKQFMSSEYFSGFTSRPRIPRTPDDAMSPPPKVSWKDPKQRSRADSARNKT
ncbi:unnamed protein product [Ophioblennius macclurei]